MCALNHLQVLTIAENWTPSQTTAPRSLRISEVLDRVGVSRPTIYRWVATGEFPKPISIGANSVV